MGFDYNAEGVDMDGFKPAPEGEYNLIVSEVFETDEQGNQKKTKKGDPMVGVKCTITDGEHAGKTVWNNVVFLPKDSKGAGIALHFLHAINQPYEGQFLVDPVKWINQKFKVKLRIEKDLQGRDRNSIAYVIIPESQDEVPF